jgi:hypothetical protein
MEKTYNYGNKKNDFDEHHDKVGNNERKDDKI